MRMMTLPLLPPSGNQGKLLGLPPIAGKMSEERRGIH